LEGIPYQVVNKGTPAILDYLRNQAEWHFRHLALNSLIGVSMLIVLILGLRWRAHHRHSKSKRKNDAF